ncbi:hypothetical protein SAMN05421666_3579, partial [Roseovarius nanhaiticus]
MAYTELDLRERRKIEDMLNAGCCHINSASLQVGVPISHQATLAAIFHASSAS